MQNLNFPSIRLTESFLFLFQARQILEGEFERLVSEGTDRQLGVPSDGRNSSADSIGGSIGDRSISPISWDLASRQELLNLPADEEADRQAASEDDDTTLSLSDVSSVIKTVSNQPPRRWRSTRKPDLITNLFSSEAVLEL